ncbi:MAG: nitrilase family protein [Candidatus Abyssubacteria bacterium]
MNDLCAAAVIMQSGFAEKDANLAKMGRLVKEAAKQGAEIVCFPELSVTGYALRDEVRALSEPVPGPSAEAVSGMARDNGVAVIAGMLERTERGNAAVTQIVALPSGKVGKYRKVHLSPGEKDLFEAGNDAPVFQMGRTTFGMQLCYDAHFPELSAVMALKGAEVLFMSHASPAPESSEAKRARWLRYLSTRAYDNSVFVVACNQTGNGGAGLSFTGVAMIIDPRGEVIAETAGDEEAMVVAHLRAEDFRARRATRMGFFLSQRRPDLYGELVRSGPCPKGEEGKCRG